MQTRGRGKASMSASKRRYKGAGDRRWPGAFVIMPQAVLHSRAFVGLSTRAVKLLMDLVAQYKGNNNGDLCAAWKIMRKRGWKSEETLNNAKKELLAANLIAETRKGGFPNRAGLYGLTWFRMDPCNGKLDISAYSFPYGAFAKGEPVVEGRTPEKHGA